MVLKECEKMPVVSHGAPTPPPPIPLFPPLLFFPPILVRSNRQNVTLTPHPILYHYIPPHGAHGGRERARKTLSSSPCHHQDHCRTNQYLEEERSNGVVIRNSSSSENYVRRERMDLARSLWDENYLEPSWLTSSKLNNESHNFELLK